jgi:predicted nuclease of predicted toxin-antitoxin system
MLRLLSDEDFNGHVVDGVRRHYPKVDLVRAQDVGLSGKDGADDPAILAWAAEQNRILLTNDRRTMIAFALNRVKQGLPLPGVFVLRPWTSISDAIEAVAMVALASNPADWVNDVHWLPF